MRGHHLLGPGLCEGSPVLPQPGLPHCGCLQVRHFLPVDSHISKHFLALVPVWYLPAHLPSSTSQRLEYSITLPLFTVLLLGLMMFVFGPAGQPSV